MDSSLPARSLPTNALTIGNNVFFPAIFAGGVPFLFKNKQIEFLYYLQQMKSVAAASIAVGEQEEWGNKFLACKKFVNFRNKKLTELSIRFGSTIEAWHQFAKWVMDGRKMWYEGFCPTCQQTYEFSDYEVEQNRTDEMQLDMKCGVCFTPVAIETKSVPFKASREQIEVWKEQGARLAPKIERVHHAFDNTEIVFESTGGTE